MPDYNCLIVEDSPLMRQHLSMALRRIKGLNVTEASDGIDGLKNLAQSKFDIVIVDINMPIMDGLKLIKHIRSEARHSEVPVVIISTESVQDAEYRAQQVGANAYFTKPINPSEVISKVKELLGIAA